MMKNDILKVKKTMKNHLKTMKIQQKNQYANLEWENEGSKIAQKSNLGRSGAPFGRSLGPSRVSLGRLWVILGRFLRIGNLTFSSHWSKMTSKRPSGWILGRFGEDLGWIWEDFGGIYSILERFWCVLQPMCTTCNDYFSIKRTNYKHVQ